ncbi:MAG TPA: hypothetical protein DCP54_09355, partial [Chryseobacterium sp.]|nr:hypothetical protein [Chryseobacterium sp.]
MTLERRLVNDAIAEYFNATGMLLIEITQKGKVMNSDNTKALQLQNIISHLSRQTEQADKIRIAFIELSSKLESEIVRLHAQGLYPDLYCSGSSQFRLMEYISHLYKDVLYIQVDVIPEFSIIGTTHKWRDRGLLDFAKDQQIYLQSIKSEHLCVAVKCLEMQRHLL